VILNSANGERRIGLDEFMVGTFETSIEPDEVLTAIEAAPLPAGFGSAFLRIEHYHRPTVNVGGAVRMADGRIAEVRLSVGCIGARTVRLPLLEKRLIGLNLDEAARVTREYGPELTETAEPVDDVLGSAAYKIHIAGVLLGRAVAQSAQTSIGA